MKTIIRLLVILLVAVAVTGVTWAVGQSSSSDTQTASVQGAPKRLPPDFGESGELSTLSAGREGREGGDFHAAQVTSLRGWLGFSETVVPIALIITLIALPTSLWKRYQRAREHTAAPDLKIV